MHLIFVFKLDSEVNEDPSSEESYENPGPEALDVNSYNTDDDSKDSPFSDLMTAEECDPDDSRACELLHAFESKTKSFVKFYDCIAWYLAF